MDSRSNRVPRTKHHDFSAVLCSGQSRMRDRFAYSLPMHKTAFITGIAGQGGAYLAELLLSKGYIGHAIKRRSSSFNTERVDHL